MQIPLWKIDDLDGQVRRAQFGSVEQFVGELRDADIAVPACWYTHGWLRARLCILMEWQAALAEPTDGHRWWTELFSLMSSAPWAEVVAHEGKHRDPVTHERVAVASIADVADGLCGLER
jgi:hypothetical protein